MSALAMTFPVFDKFRVRPVINACGIYTDLGGSVLSPRVWQAMYEVNHSFVRMVALLDRAGEMLASMLRAEAACVVPGASAAITLSTAACIAERDGNAWEQLPDTSGLKNEVIIQKAHRYKYDRMAGTPSLEEVSRIARNHGVPVLVDAAYMNDPPSLMKSFLPRGADLVCFSAKYFWGPNSSGFVCGRRDLIEAVAGIDFTRYES